MNRWLAFFFLVSPLSIPAFADDFGCTGDLPLIKPAWALPSPLECGLDSDIREWRLPISYDKPEIITAARVSVSFFKLSDAQNWVARVHFSFPDPKPYGIPFSFQKFTLYWQTPAGEQMKQVDWSSDCEFAGRSMFNGQSFEEQVELPDTADLCAVTGAQLKLWGGRY